MQFCNIIELFKKNHHYYEKDNLDIHCYTFI